MKFKVNWTRNAEMLNGFLVLYQISADNVYQMASIHK